MRLFAAHLRAGALELLRLPSFSVPTLLLPSVLFLLFAAGRTKDESEGALAGFAAMAVLGVAVFQFGAGIAIERGYPWEAFVRTLPGSPATRMAARVEAAVGFAAAATTLLVATALVTTEVSLSATRWLALLTALTLGAVPFSLLGIALGYWAPTRAAVPIANLIFLPLVVLGGLWTGGQYLPERLDAVSRGVPTRPWAEIVWAAAEGGAWPWWAPAALAAWTVAFGLLALWGYRRDEGERFR
jgi:ABC-2 type transport system permease protein